MSLQSVLLPVFVQVGLIFFLFAWMVKERAGLLRNGDVRWADIALRQTAWPARAQKVGNCFENQFEGPVLFFVLTALAILARKADLAFVVMAWIFVLTRLAHAFVFTTSNYVPNRGLFWIVGMIDLFLMWAIFAFRILAPGPA